MRQFRKNVFRQALKNKGSLAGAALIIAIGIFIYVSMIDTLKNLEGQVENYYEEGNLADIFAVVSGITGEDLESLTDIEGIRTAAGRMTGDIRIFGAGQEGIVTVHLISCDDDDLLNLVTLDGSLPDAGRIFLGKRMSDAYGYEKGEPLKLLYDGKTSEFTYAGICRSPQYIYTIPPGGAMIPDGFVYDIACVEKADMEKLTGRKDSLNELGFSLEAGYTFDDVKYELTERLRPYGLSSLAEQKDQESVNMVAGEITELITIGTVLPVLFMAISVFMMYVVLKKITDRERGLIGTMKACGMTDRELIFPYMIEGAAVGAAGGVIGSILAVPFGKFMFDMYVEFFDLPDTVYHSYLFTRASGLFLALAVSVLSVFLGVRDILKITPAEAMRPRAPKSGNNRGMTLELIKNMRAVTKIGLRSVMRNPFRGLLLSLAIAFPFAMVSTLLSFNGVADQMFMDQFEKIQVYDLLVSLDTGTSPVKASLSGESLPGVKTSEAAAMIPVELTADGRSEFAMMYGLNRGSELWKIMDNKGNMFEPPDNGIIINSRTAEKLSLREGDTVEASLQGISAEKIPLPVAAVVEESFGGGCYMSLAGIEKQLVVPAFANTIILNTEPGKKDEVKAELADSPRAAWLVDTEKIVDSYRDMMQSMLLMIHMFSLFSILAGVIMIYHISMIGIRERTSELGTLLLMGTLEKEIGKIVVTEQAVYFILGILLGIPGSRAVRFLIEQLVLSESYTVSLVIAPGAYMLAFLICLGIAGVSCAAQIRYAGKISLTEVIKERES